MKNFRNIIIIIFIIFGFQNAFSVHKSLFYYYEKFRNFYKLPKFDPDEIIELPDIKNYNINDYSTSFVGKGWTIKICDEKNYYLNVIYSPNIKGRGSYELVFAVYLSSDNNDLIGVSIIDNLLEGVEDHRDPSFEYYFFRENDTNFIEVTDKVLPKITVYDFLEDVQDYRDFYYIYCEIPIEGTLTKIVLGTRENDLSRHTKKPKLRNNGEILFKWNYKNGIFEMVSNK